MRVLFATLPTKAHLYAQVPVAWALRAAGHDVRVATRPELAGGVTETGLTAVPVGPELDQAGMVAENQRHRDEAEQAGTDGPDPEELLRMDVDGSEPLSDDALQGLFSVMTPLVFQSMSERAVIEDLVDFARSWCPDLVVWDTLFLAAPVAAIASGAAHARLLYSVDLVGRMRQRYRAALSATPAELHDDPLEEWLGAELARYGCRYTETAVVGQWTIDPVPPSMQLPIGLPSVPVRYTPYNGQAPLPRWVHRPPERTRVCLTLGLSFREVMGGDRVSVRSLLESVAELDAEVVATLDARQLEGAGPLPGNVRTADFIPLNELLPTCSAIVHQGGFGQMQTALAHGVPQVVLPNGSWDTGVRARQIEDSGAGLAVADPGSATPAELGRMVRRVLAEPAFAAAAAGLRAEVAATPAPADLVPVLERLTRLHRPRPSRR